MKTTKSMLRVLVLLSFLGLTVFSSSSSYAEFAPENGLLASLVLGQPDFTSSGPAVTAAKLNFPDDIAVDPVSRKVFVSDYNNHRILRYASMHALTNGAAAEGVLGQADFTHKELNRGGSAAANTLSSPRGLFIDLDGRLWVADSGNSRILVFQNASTKSDGADADGVLGQPDFTTREGRTSQNGMKMPKDVQVTRDGQLWVADSYNNRVLRFDKAATLENGADASGVFGQPDFLTGNIAITATGMKFPESLFIDTSGRLWVADTNNYRVLRFDNAANKANGSAADGVLGQEDFTTQLSGCAVDKINYPMGISGDPSGKFLSVTDYYNSRVLIFLNPSQLPNGANADSVLGQPDLITCTANTSGIGAGTLKNPADIFYDQQGDALWVADRGNNRVLLYSNRCYVQADAAGENTGVNWRNAYTDLQSALYSDTCKEIWVAEGTYKPTADTDRYTSFAIGSGVSLFGGFAGTESERHQRNWAAHPTVLSGDIGVEGSSGDNSYHVVSVRDGGDALVTIDGFTIKGGFANDGSYVETNRGGGIYIEYSNVYIRNVIFRDNFAFGGGGFFSDGGEQSLANVVFFNNIASMNGGGLHTFHGSKASLMNVTFSGNQATGSSSGGIAIWDTSQVSLNNSILWGNKWIGDTNAAPIDREINGGGVVSIHASLVTKGCPAWATACDGGILTTEPQFMDAENGNLRLEPGSVAVDAGDNGFVPEDLGDLDGDGILFEERLPYDLDGKARVTNGLVDLGAYEISTLYLPTILR